MSTNHSSIYKFVTNQLYDPELGKLINQFDNPYFNLLNTTVEQLQLYINEVALDLNDFPEIEDEFWIWDTHYEVSSVKAIMIYPHRYLFDIVAIFNEWEHPNFIQDYIRSTVYENVSDEYPEAVIAEVLFYDQSLEFMDIAIYHITFDVTFN